MEECKKTPIICSYGPKARDVCWSAMTDSIRRSIELHNKNSLELSDVTGSYSLPFRQTTPRAPHKRRKPSWRTTFYSPSNCSQSTKNSDDWTISYRPKPIPMNGDLLYADNDESEPKIDGADTKHDGFNNNNNHNNNNNNNNRKNNDNENVDENERKNESANIDLDQQRPNDCVVHSSEVSNGSRADTENQRNTVSTVQSATVVVVHRATPEKTFSDDSIREQRDVDQTVLTGVNLPVYKPLSKYEQKIKEVDSNIKSFSISLLFFVSIIVLLHIVF